MRAAALICAGVVSAASLCTPQGRVFLSVERDLTRKIPLALSVAGDDRDAMGRLAGVIRQDLAFSGWFAPTVVPRQPQKFPSETEIVLAVTQAGAALEVSAYSPADTNALYSRTYPWPASDLRAAAHRIADDAVAALTGRPGIACTRIAFTMKQETLRIGVVDYDGYGETTVAAPPGDCLSPSWFFGKDALVFVCAQGGASSVMTVELRTGTLRRLYAGAAVCGRPAVNPKWPELAVPLGFSGNPDIYRLGREGKELLRLTISPVIDSSPCFSPDGERIAFVSDRSGSPQVYVMRRDGRDVRRVSFGVPHASSPAWSPDGEVLAYAVRRRGGSGIFVRNMSSGAVRELAPDEVWLEEPSWAPDSRHLVCTAVREFRRNLCVVDSFTGERRMLLPDGERFSAAWSP